MRWIALLVVTLLVSAVVGSSQPEPLARPPDALRVLPVQPGSGQSGPVARPHEGHAESPVGLDALAERPDRPPWAPLPILSGQTRFVPALIELLRTGDDRRRQGAALLLGQIGSPGARPALARALRADPARPVRMHAGIALACLGDPTGLHAAVAALDGEPDWIKVYAVLGLWRLDTGSARAALRGAQRHQTEFIAKMIEEALGTPAVMPAAAEPAPTTAPAGADAAFEAALDAYVLETDWWWHYGSYDHCIRCMETVLLLDPLELAFYEDIAYLEWSLGRKAAAILTLERGTRAAPTDPQPWYYLGRHYMTRREFANAVAPLQRSVELGGDRRAQGAYGLALFRAGRVEESLALWEAIFAADPTDAHAAYEIERARRALRGDAAPPEGKAVPQGDKAPSSDRQAAQG